MAILEYVKPLEFTTGQILGRANLGVLRDNDDYFNALADRYIPIPAGIITAWESDTVARYAWIGWHLKRTDMDTLYYHAELSNDDAGHPTTLTGTYDYNNDYNDIVMFTRNTTGTSSGTIDLSSFPNGLYLVVFIMTRAGGDISYDATATIRAPYTIYTGALSYAAGTTITDGNVSAAADFNKWRSNDIYFNAITPGQIPSVGMYKPAGSSEWFNGWDKFHPDHCRIYYRIWLDDPPPNATLYYDAGGGGEQSSVIATGDGWNEGYWDFSGGGYTKGNWYRVNLTGPGFVDHLFVTAASLDASYTVMDAFAVDQFVYGSTAAQLSRLDYLTDNDASIYDRLSWNSANPGRMDFACYEPEFHGFAGGYWYGNYRLKRVGDTLYYRTKGAELLLPDGSTQGLDDYSGSGDYNTLDLNTIDLPHGSFYTIRRASYTTPSSLATPGGRITAETLEFAMEI